MQGNRYPGQFPNQPGPRIGLWLSIILLIALIVGVSVFGIFYFGVFGNSGGVSPTAVPTTTGNKTPPPSGPWAAGPRPLPRSGPPGRSSRASRRWRNPRADGGAAVLRHWQGPGMAQQGVRDRSRALRMTGPGRRQPGTANLPGFCPAVERARRAHPPRLSVQARLARLPQAAGGRGDGTLGAPHRW